MNVRAKTETSAIELFRETSNAPASFAATRAALGVAAMRGFNASLRDAETAYVQAAIDSPSRTPTFVELPREWCPDSWFVDGTLRQIHKYDRPHCRLLRALYGHPEAGALWEAKLDDIMKSLGWSSIQGSSGVYAHAKATAAMVVYVDDMLLLSSPRDTDAFGATLTRKLTTTIPRCLFTDVSEFFITSTPLIPTSQRHPAAC